MTHLQKAPRKPLLNVEQGKVFISHLDNDLHKGIAKNIFVDGMTSEEVAQAIGYSTRSVERIRAKLLKTVLKSLIEKQTPKKPIIHGFREGREINTISFTCPACGRHIGRENHCKHCGQVLDWSDAK